MHNTQQPGFLMAIWFTFTAFLASFFRRPSSAAALPTPVTAPPEQVRVSRVKHPSPLKRTSSAAASPISSSVRTSRSATPRRPLTSPERILHSPASPFPNISLSGIFATPPSLVAPIELGPLSLASPPDAQPVFSPTPSSIHGSPTPSIHTVYSRSSHSTPRTPSSAVIVRLDRSIISPTTMSDGSLEVVSLGGRRGFPGSPVKISDIARLPSPWSPIGKSASQDVWMSVDGLLVNATGPVNTSGSRMSASSLYSSSSALDAFGISVFVSLSGVDDASPNDVGKADTKADPFSIPKSNELRDNNNSPFTVQGIRTPRKRRETIPSVKKSGASGHTSRATKCLSTPLTRIENVDISHLRSASSISSMAYEFRMGLIADGRSMTAIENIISFLDQDSPEHTQPLNHPMPPVEVV